MANEPTIKSYFKLGRYYILKKLVLLVVLLLAIIMVSVPFIKYLLQNYDFTKVIVYGSTLHKNYDGKARLVSYDTNGDKNTTYIGEFKNGKYQGNGTEYYASGNVKYLGEFKNGEYDGSGTFYFEDNTGNLYYKFYNGDFKNNNYEGNGTEYFSSGSIKYEGEFKNSKYNGKGIEYFESGKIKYDGEFKNNSYEGKGVEYYNSGTVKYDGEFKNSKYHGNGKLFYSDGSLQYEGSFYCGSFDGIGVKYSSGGYKEYEGGYKNGNYSGEGTEYTIDGNVLYKGFFSDNKYNGIGTLYDQKLGDIYKGYFKEGNPFYQGFLGLSDSKLKEIVGEPNKPSDNISSLSLGAEIDDIPSSSPPATSTSAPIATPTEKGTVLSYEKYAMEFIMEPLSPTQKTPIVQVVRVSGINTVLGISCGISYKDFKDISAKKEIEMPISYKVDNFTIVDFAENQYIYTLYFNNTTDSLDYIEIKAEDLGEGS